MTDILQDADNSMFLNSAILEPRGDKLRVTWELSFEPRSDTSYYVELRSHDWSSWGQIGVRLIGDEKPISFVWVNNFNTYHSKELLTVGKKSVTAEFPMERIRKEFGGDMMFVGTISADGRDVDTYPSTGDPSDRPFKTFQL